MHIDTAVSPVYLENLFKGFEALELNFTQFPLAAFVEEESNKIRKI
jgi:hypothetical protein